MKAKCLCGNVSLEVEHDKHVHACHCGMCRTWGSGATFSLIAAKPPKIDGEANIARYHSSEWAERAFCKNCGTHLFYHFLPNDSYFVFAGLKAYPGAAVYCGTKWAVKAIMEALRMESAQAGSNIRTTTIYPAAVQSELVNHITDENASAGYRQLYDAYEIPAARVAEVVAFALAQPDDTNISEFTIGPTTQPW